jgi:hypothetical protein
MLQQIMTELNGTESKEDKIVVITKKYIKMRETKVAARFFGR